MYKRQDQLEQGGLAGAVRADDRVRLTLAHVEADVAQGVDATEPAGGALDPEQRGHVGSFDLAQSVATNCPPFTTLIEMWSAERPAWSFAVYL